jgi:hypothetical protein
MSGQENGKEKGPGVVGFSRALAGRVSPKGAEAVTEKKTKAEAFSEYLFWFCGNQSPFCGAADIESWQALIRLRGSLTNVSLDTLKDKLEDYLEAAYHLGEIRGFFEALKLIYDLGLAKDFLEQPKTLTKLQKLGFGLYWLTLRLERSRIRRNESLAQRTAKLSYAFYRLFERALKAAKAKLPKSS